MASLDDINSKFSSLLQSVGSIVSALNSAFPRVTGTASSATGGGSSLPGAPAGFFIVTNTNGAQVKVPYYNP